MTLTKATRNVATSPPRQRRSGARRGNATGWMFVGPFAIVFLAFLILPLAFALYLSLFQKSMIGGTRFVLFDNYLKAFTDPSFLDGVWFVISFSLVLIPLQMAVSLAIALILDLVTTSFAHASQSSTANQRRPFARSSEWRSPLSTSPRSPLRIVMRKCSV